MLPDGVNRRHTQASQGVDAINVHGTASANTLSAASSEGQGGIDFVLYPDQSVEHHGTGLLQIQLVGLHLGLLGRLVRVPAVDVESLHLSLLGRLGFRHSRCLGLRDWLLAGVVSTGRLDGRIGARDGWTEEGLGRCDQARGRAKRGHSVQKRITGQVVEIQAEKFGWREREREAREQMDGKVTESRKSV